MSFVSISFLSQIGSDDKAGMKVLTSEEELSKLYIYN